ncbi:RNA methyltransferase [Parasphaerochaeta coccoides]|uniref:tRNA/rRNA methyltransferase (SpoU) n=1 Tax=Parasphaerochaeta coccoides (strain ATCC BAA-1237 / DSM 17374 / SPN1) TaxID=760011 RepID=F4GH41_PARC1|nr:RNA methyltransferase [Parasphaerochaeta coccoides]AEC01516.1 tRNA/rRNA methyltransferase (SpoU) [Parasphaerochaeta coccoides DSM 17374]
MNVQENLDRIRMVLVEPQDGANIGSVCRAMKTMGLSRLVIAGGKTRADYDDDRVRTLALHAADVWENCVWEQSLESALATSILTVGATRRRGKYRKFSFINPSQLADRISSTPAGPVSIVFGREANGLTDDEVGQCSLVVTIPTSDAFPSLNLAQAVQIIAYSLYDRLKPWPVEGVPIPQQRAEQAAWEISETLERINFYKGTERVWNHRFLRDVFVRACLSETEMQRLERLFIKLAHIAPFKNIPVGNNGHPPEDA